MFSGIYNDGKTAVQHQVDVICNDNTIEIYIPGTKEHISWEYDKLLCNHYPSSEKPLYVGHSEYGEARLIIHEPRFLEILIMKDVAMHNDVSWWSIHAYSIIACGALAFFIWAYVLLSVEIAKYIPDKYLVDLGKDITKPYIKEYGACVDPVGLAALNKMTTNLLRASNIEDKYSVTIVNNPDEVNAFATPGKQIVLFSGILNNAISSSEVAGVLAHEIGHATLGHPKISIVRDLGLYVIFIAMFGQEPMLSQQLLTLKYSRDDEYAADNFAFTMLEKARTDTLGLVTFFDALRSKRKDSLIIPEFFSTHPDIENRIDNLRAKIQPGNYHPIISPREWIDLQQICNTIKKQ